MKPLRDGLNCRALTKLHMDTCDELSIEPQVKAEVERLLNELQQLLIGISIMQVILGSQSAGGPQAEFYS